MAERMSVARRAVVAVVLASAGVGAAELRDPTRPPTSAQIVRSDGPAVSAPPTAVRLTAIRIDAGHRVAVIGGVAVRVGDAVGDATVKLIRSTEVVLGGPTGPRVLQLYPGVQKHAHDARPRTAARIARAQSTPATIAGSAAQIAQPMPSHGEATQ